MTMRLEAFGGSPGVLERLIRGEASRVTMAAAALAALLRSVREGDGVFEQPPAT